MRASFLITVGVLSCLTTLRAVDHLAITEKLHDIEMHKQELAYQKKLLDQDIHLSKRILKEIYPQFKNLETHFRSLYEAIKQDRNQLKMLARTENTLKEKVRETTSQLIASRKQIYLNQKFNKKLPPFLTQNSNNSEQAIDLAIIRLETKEKILYQQLQRVREAMQEKQENISAIRAKLAEIRPALLEKKEHYKSRQQTYKDLRTQQLDYQRQHKELQRELDEYLQNLPERSGLFSKPLLIKPVSGDIEYLEEDYNAFHAGGAVITTNIGESVLSPGHGTVSFRGPLRQFGNIILIDHGKRWHSLISGVDPAVSVGQDIKRGQPIGKVSKALGGRVYIELMQKGRTRPVTFH